MNRQDLSELLNALPDEWIDSAAEPERTQKRRAFRLWAGGIAACLAVLIAAAVYPRLRVQQPERIETTAAVTETTASAPESQTLPSSVSALETTAPLTGTTSSGTTAVFSETQTAVTETVTASTAIVTETESSTDSSAAHTNSSPSSTAAAAETTEISAVTTSAATGTVFSQPTVSETTKQTTASVSSYSHITTAMRTTHEESPQSTQTQAEVTVPETTYAVTTVTVFPPETQMGNTTLECTTSLAQQQFTVPHWEEAVRRYEITQPENTQAAYSIPIHATVYTEALPELCYFDEKPEIDMTQYDAVLISAEIVSPDACIHDAIITADGRFVLMIYYPVYPKPLPVYNKHFLIAVPKKYQLTPEKIIIGECASVNAAEFDRIKYDPLTILDMKG